VRKIAKTAPPTVAGLQFRSPKPWTAHVESSSSGTSQKYYDAGDAPPSEYHFFCTTRLRFICTTKFHFSSSLSLCSQDLAEASAPHLPIVVLSRSRRVILTLPRHAAQLRHLMLVLQRCQPRAEELCETHFRHKKFLQRSDLKGEPPLPSRQSVFQLCPGSALVTTLVPPPNLRLGESCGCLGVSSAATGAARLTDEGPNANATALPTPPPLLLLVPARGGSSSNPTCGQCGTPPPINSTRRFLCVRKGLGGHLRHDSTIASRSGGPDQKWNFQFLGVQKLRRNFLDYC